MVNIIVDKNVDYKSGIYLIEFSNGYFYIGSAKRIKERIDFHCRCILSNFSKKTLSCLPLKKMKDFEGDIRISVIENIHVEQAIYSSRYFLLKKEYEYIIMHKDNKFLLNTIGKKKPPLS